MGQTCSAHEHWRWPARVPPEGERCSVVGCDDEAAYPHALRYYEEPARIYDRVRYFCELLALWVAVDQNRHGGEGMFPQEAHVAHARIRTLYYAAIDPGYRTAAQ